MVERERGEAETERSSPLPPAVTVMTAYNAAFYDVKYF